MDVFFLDPGECLFDFGHGARPQVRVVGQHQFDEDFRFPRQKQLFNLFRNVLHFEIGGEQLDEDLAQGPDVAAGIQRVRPLTMSGWLMSSFFNIGPGRSIFGSRNRDNL